MVLAAITSKKFKGEGADIIFLMEENEIHSVMRCCDVTVLLS